MISQSEIQTVADSVTTVGQARAILGAEAKQLKVGYELLSSIGHDGGILDKWSPLGTVSDIAVGDARNAARDLLDQANAYAQGIYATLPKEADDWPLDESWKRRVAGATLTGLSAVNRVQEVANDLRPNYSEEYLAALSSSIGTVTKTIGNAVAAVANGIGFWPLFGALAVALALVYVYSRAKSTVGV